MNIYYDSKMTDNQRRAELYRGSLFALSASVSAVKLCQLAKSMIEDAFGPVNPMKVHEQLPAEKTAEILGVLKPKFIHHPLAKQHIQEMLTEAGCDLSQTYFDVPRMRTAFPGNYLSSGMAIHPHYFDHPIRNGSRTYNYHKWNLESRQNAAQHVKSDTRVQPKPEEPVELEPQVRLVCPVASAYLFSAANLHSTVPNTSGVPRYSIDFRTVHLADVCEHRGAANIDSECTGTTMGDYLRGSDLSHLPEDAIASYKDGTEVMYAKVSQ
jgi:hypothetical protein